METNFNGKKFWKKKNLKQSLTAGCFSDDVQAICSVNEFNVSTETLVFYTVFIFL